MIYLCLYYTDEDDLKTVFLNTIKCVMEKKGMKLDEDKEEFDKSEFVTMATNLINQVSENDQVNNRSTTFEMLFHSIIDILD